MGWDLTVRELPRERNWGLYAAYSRVLSSWEDVWYEDSSVHSPAWLAAMDGALFEWRQFWNDHSRMTLWELLEVSSRWVRVCAAGCVAGSDDVLVRDLEGLRVAVVEAATCGCEICDFERFGEE